MADSKLLEIIQHVFLPPQLPHESTEGADEALWDALLSEVMESLRAFLKDVVDTSDIAWASHALATLQRAHALQNSPALNEPNQLAEKIRALASFHMALATVTTGMPPTDPLAPQLPIFLPKHNAGLLISSDTTGLRFEMFELQAPNKDVMGTSGRLSRTFPGPSIIVPFLISADSQFCYEVAQFITYANSDRFCLQMLRGSSGSSGKGDTVSPAMVEGLLSGILLSLGRRCTRAVRISKQTRDDVMWKGSNSPWRRSALWLFIRVVLHLQSRCITGSNGAYKKFMIFFMSLQLKEAHSKYVDMEILFCMTQKISKRVLKLKIDDEPAWLLRSEAIIAEVCSALRAKWQIIERMDSNSPAVLSLKAGISESPGMSTTIQIRKLRKYLDKIRSGTWRRDSSHSTSELPFLKKFRSSAHLINPMTLTNFEDDELGTLIHLYAFENWVDGKLSEWLSQQSSAVTTTTAIAGSLRNYYHYASRLYTHQPESLSIMYLTIMALWVELDRTVCTCHPLLSDYAPEIDEKMLEPCLLPRISDMKRVHSIEHYIQSRRQNAVQEKSSAILDATSSESFPLQFFESSERLQKLMDKIKKGASKERQEKEVELREKKDKYGELMKQYNEKSCKCSEHKPKRKRSHYSTDQCTQCRLLKQANDVKITVHEWPLPNDDSTAKAIVFALDTPKSFASWRDTTYFLLNTVFQSTSLNASRPPSPCTPVHSLSSLKNYASSDGLVLQLALTKHQPKENIQVKITCASEALILKPNTGFYRLFDTSSRLVATFPARRPDTRHSCTPILQGEEYRALQTMLSNTTHTSNEVLCRRGEVSSVISEQEFIAFGTFRAGHRLQWLNLLRQLVVQELNFRKLETELLITQGLWQMGPRSVGYLRDSHEEALSPYYQSRLCRVLESSLSCFQDNWQAAPALRVFSTIVSRILSLDRESHSKKVYLAFLKKLRTCLEKWISSLRTQLYNSQDEVAQQVRLRIFNLALDLSWTFNLDHYLFRNVIESDQDARLFFLSSLLIYHYQPPHLDGFARRMFYRHIRLLQNEESTISRYLTVNGRGLQLALLILYESNHSKLTWKRYSEPRQEWYEGRPDASSAEADLSFQYNSMTGELRRNLRPSARLSQIYEQDSSYKRLLGTAIVEVIDSTSPEYDFESRELIAGYHIFFALHDSTLRIGMKRDIDLYEVIPTDTIDRVLPHSLVSNFIHIYHRGSSTVSFRPLSRPWEPDAAEWQLQGSSEHFIITSIQGETLINPESRISNDIVNIFKPIETKKHLVMVSDKLVPQIRIKLPRLNLKFFLDITNLELMSEDFPGMYIDVDQSCNTFTGLENRLVLRSQDQDERRVLIVPDLRLQVEKRNEHVSVYVDSVSRNKSNHIEWHCFKLHPLLQEVEDNGSLSSQLYRCLIHAMTSSPFPDSLTCLTGTEQALSILRSPSANSYMKIDDQDIRRLYAIAELSSKRFFSPSAQTSMQRVEWKSTYSLSQHLALRIEVSEFLQRASRLRNFQAWQTSFRLINPYVSSTLLSKRSLARDSYLRTDTFRYDENLEVSDKVYTGRNIEKLDQLILNSYEASVWVCQEKVTLNTDVSLLNAAEEWLQPIQNDMDELDLQKILKNTWKDRPRAMLGRHWFSLHKWVIHIGKESNKYKMLFLTALMVFFGFPAELTPILWALFYAPERIKISYLIGRSFNLTLGYEPTIKYVSGLVDRACKYSHSSSSDKGTLPSSSASSSKRSHSSHSKDQVLLQNSRRELIEFIKSSWPSPIESSHQLEKFGSEFDSKMLVKNVNSYFFELQKNIDFKNYCLDIQNLVPTGRKWNANIKDLEWPHLSHQTDSSQHYINLEQMLQGRNPPELKQSQLQFPEIHFQSLTVEKDFTEVQQHYLGLIENLPRDGLAEIFYKDLLESIRELKTHQGSELDTVDSKNELILRNFAFRQEEILRLALEKTQNTLQSGTSIAERIACLAGAWPRIPLMHLVRLASSKASRKIPSNWSKAARNLTRQLADFRNLRRILGSDIRTSTMLHDVKSMFERSWADEKHPDWLVFEAEHGLVIREEQTIAANHMLERSNSNSLYQLEMGKGKSSVILPILAAELSQGSNLFRALVLGPLLPQMFNNFKKRLSYTIDRRIYYLPMARSCAMNVQKARIFRELLEECIHGQGILLVEPEHVQSFELMAWQHRAFSDNSRLRNLLMEIQQWLDKVAVDVFDESDEILRVNRELIYTIGVQQPVDFSPWRWKAIVRATFAALEQAELLSKQIPNGFEIFRGVEIALPQVRILNSQAELALLEAVYSKISQENFAGCALWTMDQAQEGITPVGATPLKLRRFVLGLDSSIDASDDLQSIAKLEEDQQKLLLLLRGLLGGGLLSFCLISHRWRVSFGLDRQRPGLAVPYRGKDTPSQRTDFSHPDVTIILTALSYFYGGLSDGELRSTIEKLQKDPSGEAEYAGWIKFSTLPSSLCHLQGINLLDQTIYKDVLLPEFRYNPEAIQSYLFWTVFPSNVREFPSKMASSGWHLARKKAQIATGFSGTNESQYLLPYPMQQKKLPGQNHTNADLAATILHTRNKMYLPQNAVHLHDEDHVTQFLSNLPSEIRVVIDVGAQFLGCDNERTSRIWLNVHRKASAAIYFDSEDNLRVIDKSGKLQTLEQSPYLSRLGDCLVYLDEPHTRGTDLNLPTNQCALVTVGPHLTLDRFMQACLRMRKLRFGQKLVVYPPAEVCNEVKVLFSLSRDQDIRIRHILTWCMKNSQDQLRAFFPLWVSQGINFVRQQVAKDCFTGDNEGREALSQAIIDYEALTIMDRYQKAAFAYPVEHMRSMMNGQQWPERFRSYVDAITEKSKIFGGQNASKVTYSEQQEREVAPENENEVERQLGPAPAASSHSLHESIQAFVKTGEFPKSEEAVARVIEIFKHTSIEIPKTPLWERSRLFASKDFAKVISKSHEGEQDLYLRPIEWILGHSESFERLIISPHEANELMPLLRQNRSLVIMSLFAARTAEQMLPLDKLNFFTFPRYEQMVMSDNDRNILCLFSGQVIFRNREDYEQMCRFLGLCYSRPVDISVGVDGFVDPADRGKYDLDMDSECRFTESPVQFLKRVMDLRRGAKGYELTHMGRMLSADLNIKF